MPGIHSQGVVVGVDDSSGSGAALAFAMSEAALRGSAVDIITAWSVAGDGDSPEVARHEAQEVQDTAVALALSEVDARPVLYRQVIEGEAGDVLSREAKDAAYLVVGASTSGLTTGLPLGSVSDYCLRHAPCAVMVVPAQAQLSSTRAKELR